MGALAGSVIDDTDRYGLDAAFPAILLALVLPSLRDPANRNPALVGAVVAVASTPFLPVGLPVLACPHGAPLVGRTPRTGRDMISDAAIIGSGAVLGLGTYAFRVAGPVLRSQVSMSKRVEELMSRAAVVLLVALTATAALTQGHEFAGWARPTGVLVAGVLAWRRAPFVVVIVVAAAVAAGLRLAGIP